MAPVSASSTLSSRLSKCWATSPTYSCSAPNASCREALCAITSCCTPSPSTNFCAARKPRTRFINTTHAIRARRATASAASARTPCVLLSDAALTANKLGHLSAGLCSRRRLGQSVVRCESLSSFHRHTLARARSSPEAWRGWAYFPKMTMKLALLFSTSVSPGTGATLTVTREAASSVTPFTAMLAL